MGGSCQTLNKQICFFIVSHSTFDVGRSMFIFLVNPLFHYFMAGE